MTVSFEEFDGILRAELDTWHITNPGYLPVEKVSVIHPHRMPENTQTCVVWVIPYYTGTHENRNVSLYSVSKDYHLFAKSLGNALTTVLERQYPGEKFYSFCDNSPINEMKAAYDAALGVRGKNHLLIHPIYGSFIFIGCLLTTVRVNPIPEVTPRGDCPGCGECEKACAYLRGETPVCLSALNQKKVLTDTELAVVQAQKIRWGCDVCQEVCPLSKDVPLTPIPFFYEDPMEVLSPEIIEAMSQEDFEQRAYAWRKKSTILRNFYDMP